MPVAPILGAAILTSTAASVYFGNKAASEQSKANQLQQAQSDLQAARVRRDAIRQARIQSATAEQTASNQGVSDSSSAIGGQASITSQVDANLSFLDQNKAFADQISVHLGNVQKNESYSNDANKVTQLATSFAGPVGSSFSSFFKGLGQPAPSSSYSVPF